MLPKISLFLILLVLLTACGSGGSGGEKTTKEPGVKEGNNQQKNKVWRINSGENSDALQTAFNKAKAGDTIILVASLKAYQFSDAAYENIKGFVINAAGTQDDPIKIIGEAANGLNKPIIDQGKNAVHNPALESPTAGILIACSKHLIIENIEIRNTQVAGISNSMEGCKSENIQLKNLYIHHVYGDHLTAGIRLANTTNSLINNNQISHIQQENSYNSETPVVINANNKRVNTTVSNNTINYSNTGIAIHTSNHSVENMTINNNHINNTDDTAIFLQATNNGIYNNVDINNNKIDTSHNAIFFDLQKSSLISKEIHITHQTIKNINNIAVYLDPINKLSAHDNSFSTIGNFHLKTNINNKQGVQFLQWNENNYTNSPNAGWLLGNIYFDKLSTWQQHIFDNGNRAN